MSGDLIPGARIAVEWFEIVKAEHFALRVVGHVREDLESTEAARIICSHELGDMVLNLEDFDHNL